MDTTMRTKMMTMAAAALGLSLMGACGKKAEATEPTAPAEASGAEDTAAEAGDTAAEGAEEGAAEGGGESSCGGASCGAAPK